MIQHGREMERHLTLSMYQRGAINVKARPHIYPGLAEQRARVRVFEHADMGQCPFRGQTALDRMHRCQRLHNTALLLGVGMFEVDGHDHLGLRGNNLQPPGAIFSDTDHVSASAAADNGAYAPLTAQSPTSCAVAYRPKGGASLAHASGYALPRMKRRSDH